MDSELEPPIEAYNGDKPYVFVSYSHLDKQLVYPLIEELYKQGARIWYDEGIPISSKWIEQIAETIINCEFFLVFITSSALKSEHVRDEISYAKSKRKRMFVIYLEDTELPSEIEFQIGRIQALFKHKMSEERFWKNLKEELSEVISPTENPIKVDKGGVAIELEREHDISLFRTKMVQNDDIEILKKFQQKIGDGLESHHFKVDDKGFVTSLDLSPFALKKIPKIVNSFQNLTEIYVSSEIIESASEIRDLVLENKNVIIGGEKIIPFREAYIPQSEADVLRELEEQKKCEFELLTTESDNIGPHESMITPIPTFAVKHNHITKVFVYGGMSDIYKRISILPESMGTLRSLQMLRVPGNELSTLPNSIEKLEKLQDLDISHNKFTTLPETIKHLKSLRKLSLYDNPLSTLPKWIFLDLKSLKSLSIGKNQFKNDPETKKMLMLFKKDVNFYFY